MADTKISDLTAITGTDTAADDDFVVVDTSAAQTKRITRDELRVSILDGPHSSSAGSVALGTDALEDSSAAGATAIGVSALKELTTGHRNTAVGNQALRDNTTSANSTAVGYSALALSNGPQNQAFGAFTLDANTTGTYNCAYGYSALGANVSGSYNVAVGGRSVLTSCVSGIANVAIGGYAALTSLDDGDYNVGIGYFAGQDLEGGSNNVLIGRNAGQDIVDADSNVCVGYVSGNDISSGQVNTCVGFNAGNTLTTGSNNTLLGRDATPSAADVDNEITLGSSSVTALRVPGVDFYIDDGDVTVGGGSIQLKGTTYTDFSDYWGSGDNTAIFTPYGYLGSNGSFAVSLFSNGYRNSSGGFTSMGLNGQSTASGIELNPSGVIQFRTGTPSGTSVPESMRITSTGAVGIGTTSPDANLEVEETSGAATVNVRGSTDSIVRARQTGNTGNGYFSFGDSADIFVGGMQYDHAGDNMRFSVNNAERVRIDSSGNVGIGTSSSVGSNSTSEGFWFAENEAARFSRASNSCSILNRITTTGPIQLIRYNGSGVGSISVTASSTAYNTSSDYRLKENVVGLGEAIDRVKLLKPSRFNFIADPDTTVDGFVAHEVSGIVPEAVHGEKDAVDADGNPEYQGIDQSKLVPLLTAALQEALTKIDALETRITALEG